MKKTLHLKKSPKATVKTATKGVGVGNTSQRRHAAQMEHDAKRKR